MMGKEPSKNFNILELESLRDELVRKTFSASSSFSKVNYFYSFFEKVLSIRNSNYYEVFLKEFIEDYTASISRFDVWGIELQVTKKIIMQLKEISGLNVAKENLVTVKSEIERIERQLRELEQVLTGGDKDEDKVKGKVQVQDKDADKYIERKAFFPLIAKDAPEGYYGILESATIHISKAAYEEKFIIIPSEKEIEKKILDQCKHSWFVALDLSREYIKKPYQHHEVVINFDKRDGFYEGSSLGIALTNSFLEQTTS